ncbi:hypothetical protein CMO89_04205 [Candidatus Woesearchaeota archaeon]|nr:hypothetical protein [Candidatus Woesearchaeota archaeon]|tara:strand:- start:5675 stop:7162 length:1488 start_codon:yes stop_codon:yes gene_type:complete
MGNYRYEASYNSAGYKDVVGQYPPVFYHLGTIFSYLTGLETYDSAYLMVFLIIIAFVMVFYTIIRKFSRTIAILSIPLSILVFSSPEGIIGPYAGITWGNWPTYLGHLFLISLFWALYNMDLNKSWSLLGLFIAAITISHTSELVFGLMFIFIYFAVMLFKRKAFPLFRKLAYSAILSIILSAYYLVIFKFGWGVQQGYKFSFQTTRAATPLYFMHNFGIILIFMGIGLAYFLLTPKKRAFPLYVSLFMFLIGLGNYYGFQRHAWRVRTLWPLYLSVFMGYGIYLLISLLAKNIKKRFLFSIGIALIFLSVFSFAKVPFIPHYQKLSTPGMMDNLHWNVLQWLRYNTEEDAKVYFFYGDIYGQDALLRNTHRTQFLVDPGDFIESLKNRSIRRYYKAELPGDSGAGYPYRKSFFEFGSHWTEEVIPKTKPRDICIMDYYVFDKASREPVLVEYNFLIMNELLKKDFIEIVHESQIAFILKNNKPGDDCIEERSFS